MAGGAFFTPEVKKWWRRAELVVKDDKVTGITPVLCDSQQRVNLNFESQPMLHG